MVHFRLLDFLRFIAAISVAILHWNIFIFEMDWGGSSAAFELMPPLPVLLGSVYDFGYYAVQFFWMLSGFVFAFVYGKTQLGLYDFAVRRIARLYPLAILSLVIVAYLQGLLRLHDGATFFYPENDLYHYFLNLLMVSAWGFEDGLSFNGPFWSVSVEIPIYFLFWVFVRYLPMNAVTCLIVAAGFFLLQDVMTFTHVDYCGLMFFLGASVFFICKEIPPVVLIGLALLSWGAGVVAIALLPVLQSVTTLMLLLAFAPLMALTSALDRLWAGRENWALNGARVLGDLSYAIYLMHFPVILALTLIMIALGIDRSVLSENIMALLIYLAATIWVSYLTYNLFERRARRWLRQVLSDGALARTGSKLRMNN